MKRLLLPSTMLLGCVQIDALESTDASASSIPPRVQAVFDSQCATSGCHDATTRAGGLSLTAADSGGLLSGAPSNQEPSLPLLARGSIDDSYLAIKLLAEPPAGRSRQGERMPLGGSTAPDEIALLLGWIAGAEVGDEPPPDEDAMDATTGEDQEPAPTSRCGVERLAASGEASIDAGLGPDQIPAVIADVIGANCGCHLAETLIPEAASYAFALPFDLTTLEGWRATVDGRVASEVIRERVIDQRSMPPAYACDDGSGETISAGDVDLLSEWIASGLPAGDAWP